jgi:hypothetical protein
MKKDYVKSFWKKVKRSEPNMCWEWIGSLQLSGYGNSYNGSSVETAHRVSYKIHYGEITKGLDVMHICDNRKCVNPNHIKLGTRKDNMLDCRNKGRINGFKKGIIPHNKRIGVERYLNERIKYDQRRIKNGNNKQMRL